MSDADDIAALRITIEETLDADIVARLEIGDSRDINFCVGSICSELSIQTARSEALEALNATMHERISGLVAEIAQERDRSAKLLEALDSVDELVECERRMARSESFPAEYNERANDIYDLMRAATKRYPAP